MAYENLCMYCFEDNGGNDICPHCGRDARAAVPQIQLLPGTLIYKDRFLVGRALGQDAGGIVYSALDTKRNVKIRIREYLPRDSARRLNSGEVVPEAGCEDRFDAGLKKLCASVEGVEDPTKRHFFFEENGTGYIAQRKSAGGGAEAEGGDDEKSRGPRMGLVVGVAAALVLAVAVGVIALVSFLTNRTDNRTDAPMTTGEDVWQPPESPTPTPYVSATFGAITDPESDWMDFTNPDLKGDEGDFATPTPVPTPDDGFDITRTINEKSSPETIKKLQKILINLGWLEKGGRTGEYDAATKQAVKDFQQYMNETYAIDPKLTVDGVAGPKTLAWLVRTDLSRKPDPTPKPVTPNPTYAEEIIDEKASPERIKYVQGQLVKLGILGEGYPSGTYDKNTRNGVAKFQRRVNDLQGYDALREDGTCDASTLAYLDYYVEWWQSNKPTSSPTQQPTLAPSGDVIDENSNPESIKAVQKMLIALGYLEGSADGSYGQATYAAVKQFQTFINIQHDNVVNVTGKCDEVTRNYLEYYYANLGDEPTAEPTEVPSVAAPTIQVTGELSYANGVYAVGKDGIMISWSAEGADAYSIYLTDASGKVVSKEQNTDYTSLSLGKDKLSIKEAYTFTVTAIPKGGDEAHGASAYVKLIAAADAGQPTAEPTSAPSIAPAITVSGALGYNGGVYQIGASGASISWVSEGAGSYSFYLTDGANEVVDEQRGVSLTEYQLDAAKLKAGEKYTFTVVAIPRDGAENDGEYASVRLTAAESQTPESTTTPAADVEAPVITVDGALGYKQDIYWAGDEKLSISWSAKGSVRAYSIYLTNHKGETLTSLTETDKTSMTVDPASMAEDERYTVTVIAIPDGGSESDGRTAAVDIQRYTGQTAEPTPGQVTAPVITVSGHAEQADGVYYARRDALTIAWEADGAVAGYDLVVIGSDDTEVLNKTGVTKTSTVISPEDMAEGVVYTMTVTAVPEGGTAADGQSASVKLALYQPPKPTAPEITVSGNVDFADNVYYMDENGLSLSWTAENAAAYSLYLSDSQGKIVESAANSDKTNMNLKSASLAAGEVYTFTVIAIPQDGEEKDGMSASVLVALAKAETPAVQAPAINVEGYADYDGDVYYADGGELRVTWTSEGAASYNVRLRDADGEDINAADGVTLTQMSIDSANMKAGMVYTLSIAAIPEGGKPTEEATSSIRLAAMEAEATPEPATIGIPEISVSGHAAFENETYLVGADKITVNYQADNAATYDVTLTDSNGNVIKSNENVDKTAIGIKPDLLTEGEVYTLAVTPHGANGETGESAYIMIALYTESGDEPVTITPESDPALITKLQKALYNLGWLTDDMGFTPGTLDAATVQAVYDYQYYVGTEGINPEISLIDAANPVVDAVTISMLSDTENPVYKP
jgi:peptidoglycan hydrolase-like protein with peptidoglycan-binding domain